jgi:hypothetical protein
MTFESSSVGLDSVAKSNRVKSRSSDCPFFVWRGCVLSSRGSELLLFDSGSCLFESHFMQDSLRPIFYQYAEQWSIQKSFLDSFIVEPRCTDCLLCIAVMLSVSSLFGKDCIQVVTMESSKG